MDENKITGFDSAVNTTNSDQTFNPTPMFAGMNKADADVPAEQTSVNNPPAENIADASTEIKNEETKNIEQKPVSETIKTDFLPSGTYSYSAANGNLQSSAYSTPQVNPVSDVKNEPTYHNTVYTPSTPPTPEKKPKNKKYGAGVIIVSAILAAIIGAGGSFGAMYLTGSLGKTEGASVTEPQNNAPQNITNITVDETVNSSIEAVAKKAGPSIVGIRTTAAVMNFFGGSSEATGEGSGIIYRADGYIITNYHVIQSAVESSNAKVEVFLPEDVKTAITAKVIDYNIASDLAVVKIEKTGLNAIEFADSDKLKVGQYAIAIGNPGGLEFIGSVSSGVISGLNRSVSVDSGTSMSLIQTDAAINPGNSGGALVDINGKLIGVNSVKLVSTGYEGMGFAIPSNTVKEICDKMISNQNKPAPYIGIEISRNYTSAQLKALGYPAGAVVISVTEGGPADESDIKRGDIITEFNGVAISGYTDLENAISQCNPGETVTVKIFRAGRFYSTNINIKANNA